jgi:hypothetical protein
MPGSFQHFHQKNVTEALRNAASRAGLPFTGEPQYGELDPSGHSSGNARGGFYAIINPDLNLQPLASLSITPAAAHPLPPVLLTLPALPLPLRARASTVHSLAITAWAEVVCSY